MCERTKHAAGNCYKNQSNFYNISIEFYEFKVQAITLDFYSVAAVVTYNNRPVLRGLLIVFPDDYNAVSITV